MRSNERSVRCEVLEAAAELSRMQNLGFDGFFPFDDDGAVLYRALLPAGGLQKEKINKW